MAWSGRRISYCCLLYTSITRYVTVALALIESIAMSIGFGRQGLLEEFNFVNVAIVVCLSLIHIYATAISKGKGFQGAIKRHNQSRGPMTHGSKFHRHAGSNGAASDPSKVFKGKKMPGQMGGKKITVQNLEVVRVDAENNLLLVKGSVPGPKKSLITIKETVKAN